MHRLQVLVLTTVALSFALILLGGVVRITGAGMGCGDDWPVCNGAVVPTFSYLTALEYAHRVVAALLTVFTLSLLVVSWRSYRHERRVVQLALLALLLVLVQAGLGAVTVFLELEALVVTAHLGLAQTYLATLLVLGFLTLRGRIRPDDPQRRRQSWSTAGKVALAAALGVFLLMLSGAYTATTNASYACPEWPLCGPHYVPTGWSAIDVQLLHRWLALLATLAVLAVLVVVRRQRPDAPALVWLATAAAGLMLLEVLVGAANIWFVLAPAVRAAHLGVATLVWAVLVSIVTLDRLIPQQTGADVAVRDSEWARRTLPDIVTG